MLDAGVMLELARGRDMWATQDPSAWGLWLGVAVAVVASAAVYRALRQMPHEPSPMTPPQTAPEVQRVQAARRRLDVALASTGAAQRAALEPLLAGPLREVDQRIAVLAADAARAPSPTSEAEQRARAQLERELASEPDPRARALLAATLADLDAARRVHTDLATQARLARLELRRLQGLLEALPARMVALAQRDAGTCGVEAIARQLEQAVSDTREVLEPDALDPARSV